MNIDDLPLWCDPALFDEIAGILEYDAKFDKDTAELLALIYIQNQLFEKSGNN
jgi:hypothetical protein